MTDYAMYLSFDNEKQAIQLPIVPPFVEVSESGTGKTYDISKLGEINVIKNPKLTEISFGSFFPATRSPLVSVANMFEPAHYIDRIKEWRESKRPVHFVFVGSSVNINLFVSIEKFTWKEVGGAVGDIEYQLSLKKYIFYAAKKVTVVTRQIQGSPVTVLSAQAPPRADNRQVPKTYTLVSGDTLWKVAQKVLGDGSRYREIQKLNNITDAQLKTLQIGRVLKLP